MKIECNIWFGDEGRGVMIECEEAQDPTVKTQGMLDASQHAASHFLVEIVRCLALGRSIDHHFNPALTTAKLQEQEQLVRCIWKKNGKLFMLGPSDKRWKHAHSAEEAIIKQRVFTCTRTVFDMTPKRRLSDVKHKGASDASA